MANSFKVLLKYDIIEVIKEELPKEWTNSNDYAEDVDALFDYIMYRINNIDKICDTIIKYTEEN